jgi:hypothetical protein
MDIDLLEDVITVSFLREFNFSLEELQGVMKKLKNLESIKKEMVKYGVSGESEHSEHLRTISDNIISVTTVINSLKNTPFQSLGIYGEISLN